jgi:4-hydroxybenzoate polyprenyltransferase
VGGFDIIYAMQDEDFDRSENLHSIPTAVGKRRSLLISILLHVLSVLFVFTAGLMGGFGIWYWAGMILFAGMLIYQHTIVKPNDLSRVNLAFMTANGIASLIFALFVIADMLITHKHL